MKNRVWRIYLVSVHLSLIGVLLFGLWSRQNRSGNPVYIDWQRTGELTKRERDFYRSLEGDERDVTGVLRLGDEIIGALNFEHGILTNLAFRWPTETKMYGLDGHGAWIDTNGYLAEDSGEHGSFFIDLGNDGSFDIESRETSESWSLYHADWHLRKRTNNDTDQQEIFDANESLAIRITPDDTSLQSTAYLIERFANGVLTSSETIPLDVYDYRALYSEVYPDQSAPDND